MDTSRWPTSDVSPLVSIVVPVMRDTGALEELLEILASRKVANEGHADEVIVVNGDPEDRSIEQARERFPDVRWVTSRVGRGRQMNAGAAVAVGRWLLFLHADSYPDPGWLEELRQIDGDQRIVGGAFLFKLRSRVGIARLIEWGVAWRVRWLGLPYGDQGFVVRRAIFNRIYGFSSIPIMEDVDLVRRLQCEGQVRRLETPIRVSARRWERDGWARRTCLNLWLLVLFYFGVSPDRLARRYYGATVNPGWIKTFGPKRSWSSLEGSAGALSLVGVVIPALNEEDAIQQVVADIPEFVSSVTVVDNGSTDRTRERAEAGGARVVTESRRGYGRACLAGLREMPDVDVVVFLDVDRSDYPASMVELVTPILERRADLVMGDRSGVMRPAIARFGTGLCVGLINLLWHTAYRDLGPFRAIRRDALDLLGMNDQTWGWTIEMQVKSAEAGLRILEVPIRQRARIGRSKISGTFAGAMRSGARMLVTIWWLWWSRAARRVR